MKLYLDPGHGGTDPGATGNGLQEKDVVLDIALRIRDLLIGNYENVSVHMSRTGDTTKSLAQRTNEANLLGADYFLSIHCNAFNGSADGYEDFIHSNLLDSSQTAVYRDILHAEIIKLNGLRNRGKKKANFHVLRESSMPAMLTENGFIDHSGNAALMKQNAWKQQVAEGHVNGLARAFNLQEINGGTGQLYKVIAGSFKSKANADDRVSFLNSKGIQSFVEQVTISGETWYRVQAGAFTNRTNAENHLQVVRNTGIDAFIIVQ
ncbi:N-acetylmuramoyl-L-alanine amidase [Oceanobacillus polygoni]|uniref:N-acetylmuramoyl-L-alanine amidase n=1 Tax=Oceanobacillus polygoni TaxID=1235259 RepID=A0A9X0YU29_9BACI|nr:N-acetylmuramoyl-L-alanine amidase [Oceanobacillus polygoni]MBP2078337.1 N-acetylmuramoyl-L-alanine amidase [Oceanobacillus polygoni]